MDLQALRLCVLEALEKCCSDHEIDIVDVEIAGAQKSPIVRIRIDNAYAKGDAYQLITLDEVALQNDWISAVLDELDPIETSYTLEVSSPGMARPLRTLTDFKRFAGSEVSLKLKHATASHKLTGVLKGLDEEGHILLDTEDTQHVIDLDNIAFCKLIPDFSL